MTDNKFESDMTRFTAKMGSDIEYIKLAITELKAGNDTIHRDLDAVKRNQAISERDIKAMHKRVDSIESIAEEHEKLKNKAFGVISFLGLIFGSVGAGVAYIIKGLME